MCGDVRVRRLVCASAVGGGVKVKWDGVGVRNVVWGGLEVAYWGIQCRVQKRYCTVLYAVFRGG